MTRKVEILEWRDGFWDRLKDFQRVQLSPSREIQGDPSTAVVNFSKKVLMDDAASLLDVIPLQFEEAVRHNPDVRLEAPCIQMRVERPDGETRVGLVRVGKNGELSGNFFDIAGQDIDFKGGNHVLLFGEVLQFMIDER